MPFIPPTALGLIGFGHLKPSGAEPGVLRGCRLGSALTTEVGSFTAWRRGCEAFPPRAAAGADHHWHVHIAAQCLPVQLQLRGDTTRTRAQCFYR